MDVPNSAVLVVSVSITPMAVGATLTGGADTIIAQIQNDLVADGFTIAQHDTGLSGWTYLITGNFTATLQILNQSGQDADDTDIQASFQTACDENNLSLTQWGPQQVIGGTSGTNSGTGATGNVLSTSGAGNAAAIAAAQKPTVHQCGDPSWSAWQDPVQYIKCMTQSGLTSVGLLAIGLLVGIILIVYVHPTSALPRRA